MDNINIHIYIYIIQSTSTYTREICNVRKSPPAIKASPGGNTGASAASLRPFVAKSPPSSQAVTLWLFNIRNWNMAHLWMIETMILLINIYKTL